MRDRGLFLGIAAGWTIVYLVVVMYANAAAGYLARHFGIPEWIMLLFSVPVIEEVLRLIFARYSGAAWMLGVGQIIAESGNLTVLGTVWETHMVNSLILQAWNNQWRALFITIPLHMITNLPEAALLAGTGVQIAEQGYVYKTLAYVIASILLWISFRRYAFGIERAKITQLIFSNRKKQNQMEYAEGGD